MDHWEPDSYPLQVCLSDRYCFFDSIHPIKCCPNFYLNSFVQKADQVLGEEENSQNEINLVQPDNLKTNQENNLGSNLENNLKTNLENKLENNLEESLDNNTLEASTVMEPFNYSIQVSVSDSPAWYPLFVIE